MVSSLNVSGGIDPKTLWEKVGRCDMSLIAHKPQDHLTWWETCYVIPWGLQWGKKTGAYWTPQDAWLCLESDSIWSHNTPRYYWIWLSPLLIRSPRICIWCFHVADMWMLTPIHGTDWQLTSLIFEEDIMDLLDKLDLTFLIISVWIPDSLILKNVFSFGRWWQILVSGLEFFSDFFP